MMLVSIEGNIGCGKSTVLEGLRRRTHANGVEMNIEPEPIEEWTHCFDNEGRISMLGEFYKDPNANAFAFQMFVLHTRLTQYKRIWSSPDPVTIIERSLLSERAVFASTNISRNPCAWNCYTSWHDRIMDEARGKNEVIVPKLIVYMRCTPNKCQERVETRSRGEETKVDAAYFQVLHDAHEVWIDDISSEEYVCHSKTRPMVMIVDATPDGQDAINEIVEDIAKTIEQLLLGKRVGDLVSSKQNKSFPNAKRERRKESGISNSFK